MRRKHTRHVRRRRNSMENHSFEVSLHSGVHFDNGQMKTGGVGEPLFDHCSLRSYLCRNNTRETDDGRTPCAKTQTVKSFFRILQQHFCHDDHKIITFEDAARNVEDTRGNLSIQKSLSYETALKVGLFTPAQFRALSFILVENIGFAKLLMFLLQKRLRRPWTMKLSTKPFPYNILQVQKQTKHNITEVNQQHVTAESQVAHWNAFPLDVYGLPCDNRETNNTRWTTEELSMLRNGQ